MRRPATSRLFQFCTSLDLCRIAWEEDQRLARGFEDSITVALSFSAFTRPRGARSLEGRNSRERLSVPQRQEEEQKEALRRNL